MLRAGFAAALIGYGAAVALSALGLVHRAPAALARTYWPVVLLVAGLAGLRAGVSDGATSRWLAAGLAVAGLVLLVGHLAGVPIASLVIAGLLVWAGVAVWFSGRGAGGGPGPSPR